MMLSFKAKVINCKGVLGAFLDVTFVFNIKQGNKPLK